MAKINDLYPLVLILGITGILVVLFLVMLQEMEGMAITTGTTAGTEINNTIDALANIIDWLPLLVIIVIIEIVLGVVIGSLVLKGTNTGGF